MDKSEIQLGSVAS